MVILFHVLQITSQVRDHFNLSPHYLPFQGDNKVPPLWQHEILVDTNNRASRHASYSRFLHPRQRCTMRFDDKKA